LTEPSGNPRTDAELMADLASGDTHPLGELYRRHGDVVYRFICRLLVDDPAQAEDLCQEVFLAIASSARGYEDRGRFRSWVLGVAVRTTRSWQRRRWLLAKILRLHGATGLGTAAPVDGGPERKVACREGVAFAISRLTPDQRAVFLLHTAEGMTGAEIAAALGISENAVWQRLKRAHQIAGETARQVGLFSGEGAVR
jgi:RNA polymerase sigma-70 factor (ECF subfamily)